MTLVAAKVRDAQHAWGARRSERGLEGTRHYLVTGTDDPVEALSCGAPLPAMGEAWKANDDATVVNANLVVVGLEPVVNTYQASAGNASVLLRVDYRTPGLGGRADPSPQAGTKWSVVRPQTAQVTVYTDADIATLSGSDARRLPINNGFGCPKDAGLTVVDVMQFIEGADVDATLMNRLIALNADKNLNDDTLTLPGLAQNSGVTYALAAGQARFLEFDLPEAPEVMVGSTPLYKLRVSLLIAPAEANHGFTWQQVDDEGKPINAGGSAVNNRLYTQADLGGLW